jgi:hypothetical protein
MFHIKSGFQTRDARRKTAVDVKYMRKTTGFTGTDYKTNKDITK